MINWEAHACLPLHPQASFAPIERFHAAGVHYVSINIGMDMNPLPQVMAVIVSRGNNGRYISAEAVAALGAALDQEIQQDQ